MLKTIVMLTAPALYCKPGLIIIINDSWYGVVHFYLMGKKEHKKASQKTDLNCPFSQIYFVHTCTYTAHTLYIQTCMCIHTHASTPTLVLVIVHTATLCYGLAVASPYV